MADDSLPWDQKPGYLAAIATTVAPGRLTAYRVPRPVGSTPSDVTAFMPGQAEWAVDNYSEILYQLFPTKAWYDFKKSRRPSQQIDVDGSPMVEPFPLPSSIPRPLLDFPILPPIIGTAESAPYFETVRRWDPRIRWADITMRMPLSERPPSNTLQMRVSRFLRDSHSLIAWHDTCTNSIKPSASRDRVLRGLTDAQKRANTTRGSTPGLIDPSLGVTGGVVPYPILRRGQGHNRKLRKDGASVAAGQPRASDRCGRNGRATQVSLGRNKLEEVEEKEEDDLFDITKNLDGTYKRKRNDASESHDVFGNTFDWPGRRIKQGSSSAEEDRRTQSNVCGLRLDPVLLDDSPIAPTPLLHELHDGQAETVAWDEWLNPADSNQSHGTHAPCSTQSATSFLKRKGNDVDGLQNVIGDQFGRSPKRFRQGCSTQSVGEAITRGHSSTLRAPISVMVAPRTPVQSLREDATPRSATSDEQVRRMAWDDWIWSNPDPLGQDETGPGSLHLEPNFDRFPSVPSHRLPQVPMVTPFIHAPSLHPQNEVFDVQAESLDWKDWLNPYKLDIDQFAPGG